MLTVARDDVTTSGVIAHSVFCSIAAAVVVNVHFLFLLGRLTVEFIVLWVVDGVTIDFLGWLREEVVWGKEVPEVPLGLLLNDVGLVELVLGDVWVVTWGPVVDWCRLELCRFKEVDSGAPSVVKVVIPIPWW